MRQLSPQDASFWYFETPHSAMHIGGLYIFQGRPKGKPYTYEDLLNHLKSRAHIAKVFTERVVEVPMDLDLPYWVEDPDFDIELHCQRLSLFKPHNRSSLMEMAAEIFARPLDRSRPLWEVSFIEGIEHLEGYGSGSFALVVKVHHCAIDGISGAEMLAALLDIDSAVRESSKQSHKLPENVRDIPSGRELMMKSFGPSIKAPFKLAGFASQTGKLLWTSYYKRYRERETTPPLYFSAPKTIFDQKISPHRAFSGVQLPLPVIKKIKNAIPDLTVNDVVLAICAGALRRYLEEKDEMPIGDMVAMVPISTHAGVGNGGKKNSVSAMLVSLATDFEDPIERLNIIHQSEDKSKDYSKDIHVESLLDHMPPMLEAFLGKLYARLEVRNSVQSIFNLVVTNIPGPQFPLYFDGCELKEQLGMAPVADGIGLILVVMSYNGSLSIAVTACREIMPDADLFSSYLESSLGELEAAVDKLKDAKPKAVKPKAAKPKAKAKPHNNKTASKTDKTNKKPPPSKVKAKPSKASSKS